MASCLFKKKNGQIHFHLRENLRTRSTYPEKNALYSHSALMDQFQVDDNYRKRNSKTPAHTNREHSDHVIQSDARSRSSWSNALPMLYCRHILGPNYWTRLSTTNSQFGTLKIWLTDIVCRVFLLFVRIPPLISEKHHSQRRPPAMELQ